MARRPLEALELPYWGNATRRPWTAEKTATSGSLSYFKLNGLGFTADEAKKLHAWLGKVVDDINLGV